SWSLIDSEGREKPAYFAVQRAFAPRLLTAQPVEGTWFLFAVNDTDEPWQTTARVRRVAPNGAQVAESHVRFASAARSITNLGRPAMLTGDPDEASGEFIEVTSE